jgi:hypothetical protein
MKNADVAKISADALTAQAQDTHQALEIARQSVAAAERLAEANEILATAGQRGWLVVTGAQVSTDSARPRVAIRSEFTFKNVGKVPISGIRLGHCERSLIDAPKDFAGLKPVHRPTIAPDDSLFSVRNSSALGRSTRS